jgi:hypothetical protein
VVHRGATAVVYRRARTQSTASYWGCLRSSEQRTALPGSSSQRTLSSFRSAGRFLAFFADEQNFHDQTARVAVRAFDLRTRTAVRGVVLPSAPDSDPRRLRVSSLILTATGAAAWRQSARSDRIAARDVNGKHVVLASGPSGSLRELVLIRGTTAQWRNNGQLQSRRLDRLGR